MIRLFALLGALTFATVNVAAQTVQAEPPFEPAFPTTRAQGDAVVASASGFESLYANPAGFAIGKPSFTLLSIAPGLAPIPTSSSLERLGAAWSRPQDAAASLGPSLLTDGFGSTVAAGIGYTGSGLGLGLIMGGETWGSASLNTQITVSFVGGMAFNVGKHFSFGGAVRPMVRIDVPSMQVGELFSFLQDPAGSGVATPSLYGFGVALDVGGIAQYGPLRYGLAVTNIAGTRMYYAQNSLHDLASSVLGGAGLPNGQTVSTDYVVPMQATFGVGYHPKLGRVATFFDPTVEVDYAYRFDPVNMLKTPTSLDLIDGIRAGLDLRLFSFFHLRAGYEYGRLTGGAGVDLPGFQVGVQLFEQVSPSSHYGPSRGASAGISIHF